MTSHYTAAAKIIPAGSTELSVPVDRVIGDHRFGRGGRYVGRFWWADAGGATRCGALTARQRACAASMSL